jgi:hypothetical protein
MAYTLAGGAGSVCGHNTPVDTPVGMEYPKFYSMGGFRYDGDAWYRTKFVAPTQWLLDNFYFEAVAKLAQI